MNYEHVIEFMFKSLPIYQRVGAAAYKANLNNTLLLDDAFGQPHKKFKTIHVAGTNGKGSVSHSLASILQEAGYKTGLYTSPHLVDYRERIKVNGKIIDKNFVSDFINSNIKLIKEITPSFFEMSVALAFKYFETKKIDIAVVEVGMGGRLDSTNIINPQLSIITNIGLDHPQFLGNTLAQIAHEKAGIIKKETPVVIGEEHEETKPVFINKAKELKSNLSFASKNFSCKIIEQDFEFSKNFSKYKVENKIDMTSFYLNFALSGKYQEKNLATILETVEQLKKLGLHITNENVKQGLLKVVKNTGLRGRWEIVNSKPLVICDTGHNKEGLSFTIPQLLSYKYNKLKIIVGFVNDKTIDEILKLFPKNADYYFTKAQIPRALDEKLLSEKAKLHGLNGKIVENVALAYQLALKESIENDLIFVGGSTFVVGDLLATL